MSRKFYLFLSTLIILTIFIPLCVSAGIGTQPGGKQPSHPISEITQGTFQVGVYELSSETTLNGSGVISLLSTSKDKSIFGQGAQFGVEGVGSRIGVYGHSLSGYGVYGHSLSGYGVHGSSNSSYGVYGITNSGYAVVGNVSPGGLGYSGYFTGGQGVIINGSLKIDSGNLRIENGELYVGGKAVVTEQLGVRTYPRTGYVLDVYGNVGIRGSGATITLQTTDTNWPSLDLKNSAGEIKGTIGYSVLRDQVYFGYGANTQQFVISNTGNIGIGTTDPAYKLDVSGALRLRPSSQPTADNGVIYYDSSSNKFRCYQNGVWVDCIGVSGSGTTNYLPLWTGPNTLGSSIVYQAGENIGIGTTAPTQKLDVAGYVKGTGLCIGDDCRTSWPTVGQTYWVLSGNNLTPSSTAWNVGIGTTAPDSRLSVRGAATESIQTWRNSDGTIVAIIDSSGNVGIGTRNPSGKLQVSTHIYAFVGVVNGWQTPRCQCDTDQHIIECPDSFETSEPTGNICYDQYNISNINLSRKFQAKDDASLFVSNNGNVGIGTTAPGAKLDVEGDIRVTGKVKFGYEVVTSTSDDGVPIAYCPSGKKVLGGGCWQSPYAAIRTSGPVDPSNGGIINGWSCRFIESRSATAYAICANVE